MSLANEQSVCPLQEIWSISWIQEEVTQKVIPKVTIFADKKKKLNELRVHLF